VPIHAEDYVHRIGRTGRAGREGRAFTLATPEDGRFVSAITKLIGKDIPAITVEGIGGAELSEDEGEHRRERGGRGRGRGRGGRHDGRERGERREPREPAQAEGENGRRDRHSRPERDRRDGAERRPLREAPRPVTMDPEGKVTPLPRRDERRDDHDDDRRVVGFGDHLPAFLARPPRIARG
ncbi:MAG TPA: DEAD/DEAH box helicase, partial [Alphaproteobacteria bacterium]|nr:DEAD/DEAH box helicase [Alphaproteobacteria bacterium]